MAHKKRWKKPLLIAAGALATLSLIGGVGYALHSKPSNSNLQAKAETVVGGGSISTGGGSGGVTHNVWGLMYDDDQHLQGHGQASIDFFQNQIADYARSNGLSLNPNLPPKVQTACTMALNNANNRARAAGINPNVHPSRVVALTQTWGRGGGGNMASWGATADTHKSYGKKILDQSASINGTLFYWNGVEPALYNQVINEWSSRITQSNITTVCVALAHGEPPEEYHLSVKTKAQKMVEGNWLYTEGKGVGGNNTPVRDEITVSSDWNGEGTKALKGKVTLTDVTSGKKVTKPFNLTNRGGKYYSEQFTPADFGEEKWGDKHHYYFDVQIDKQDMMSGVVGTPDDEVSERFYTLPPRADKAWVSYTLSSS